MFSLARYKLLTRFLHSQTCSYPASEKVLIVGYPYGFNALGQIDLCRKGPLWLWRDDYELGEVGQSISIGITRAADHLL
jgi:hypothetical protein